jgi:hypothetical protein
MRHIIPPYKHPDITKLTILYLENVKLLTTAERELCLTILKQLVNPPTYWENVDVTESGAFGTKLKPGEWSEITGVW